MTLAKPFVKWVGGKSQLLDEIREKYPYRIEKYCEPFVGGGAVLFDILQKSHPEQILINDINKELINTYSQVKNNCEALISLLTEIQSIYKKHSNVEMKVGDYKECKSFIDNKGVPAKAVGCSALRYRSFLHFVTERLRRCSIA